LNYDALQGIETDEACVNELRSFIQFCETLPTTVQNKCGLKVDSKHGMFYVDEFAAKLYLTSLRFNSGPEDGTFFCI